MFKTSSAFAEIQNICNAAKHHRSTCTQSDCGVALYLLGLTAKRLIEFCWLSERNRARILIAETDWS